jgi:glycosyltransferase involved in cell wall biosynthesis
MAIEQDKLRILLLADASSFHTERFSEQLKKIGHDIFIASMEHGVVADVTMQPIGPFKSFHYILAKEQLKEIIKQFKPDIISAHYASGYGLLAALVANSFKIPTALSLWGSDIFVVPKKSFLHRWKTKYALNSADIVIGDSDYLIEQANKITDIKKRKKIYWGIEKEFLTYHKKDYFFSKPLKIIVPRHHEDIYNNIYIIQALKDLINDNKIVLTFPSFGSKVDIFKREAHKLINNNIYYYDKMPRADFIRFMSEHDIYLSASKSDSSPVSLIEAMALGLLPVVAKYPGISELVKNQELVFEQNNPDSLLSVMNRIIFNDDNYENTRQENLKFVKENAIFGKNIEHHIDLFTKLINR